MTTKKQREKLKKKIRHGKKKTVLAFVPKKENEFQPFLVRRLGFVLVIAIAVGLQLGYNFAQTGSVLGKTITITPNSLLAETNERRNEEALPALTLNDQLSQAAMLKANDIIQNQYWDHISPNGVSPWQWIRKSGYNYQEAGENLARNFTSSSATVSGWMASESHRNNMLKPNYSDVGFAVTTGELDGKATTIVVALYAEPIKTQELSKIATPYTASASTSDSSSKVSDEKLPWYTRPKIAIQSLTPAALTSIVLLLTAATVATTAHAHRRRLPKRLQKTWYKKHGAIKASIFLAIAAFIILLYSSGSL